MFYIVKSDTSRLREKISSKIISSKGIGEDDIFVFDYEETKDIEKALLEYLSLSFVSNKKAILIKNANFVNEKSLDKVFEDHFIKALNADVENVIIMTVSKLNKTGKIVKKYLDKMEVLEKDAPVKNELRKFIDNFFLNNNMNVEDGVVDNIYNRLGEDFDLIVSELNKLEILYKDIITNEMVDKIILNFSRERLYTITNSVFQKDIKGITRMIKQLISEGESSFMVGDALNRVGSSFLRYCILREKGYGDNEISSMTGWSPWFVRNYSSFFIYWKDSKQVYDFYYGTILQSSFFDMIDNQPKDALRQMEKLLISSISSMEES